MDFADGIYALGLWEDVVFWPLRSSQNAGTNSTVYSLGGSQPYNGTLTNEPTWGADGVETLTVGGTAPTKHIFIPLTRIAYSSRSCFTALNLAGYTLDDSFACTCNWDLAYGTAGEGFKLSTRNGLSINFAAGVATNYKRAVTVDTITQNEFCTTATVFDSGVVKAASNGRGFYTGIHGAGTPATTISDTNPLHLLSNGAVENNRGLCGTMAFYLDTLLVLTDAQYQAIHNLYKITLGNGLGIL